MFSINEFRTSINTKGILRSNRYFVSFKVPKYLMPKYGTLGTRLMSIRCESVSIPGFSFLSADGPPRFGYGPVEKNPYVPGFDGINLTFILDAQNQIYKFFYDWTMCIVNYNGRGGTNMRNNAVSSGSTWRPYEVGYKSDYQTDLDIFVYDGNKNENSSSEAGKLVMSLKAYSAFPMGLPSTPLAWESTDAMKLSIPFSYTDFQINIPEPTADTTTPVIQPRSETPNNIALNTVRLPQGIPGNSDIRNA